MASRLDGVEQPGGYFDTDLQACDIGKADQWHARLFPLKSGPLQIGLACLIVIIMAVFAWIGIRLTLTI